VGHDPPEASGPGDKKKGDWLSALISNVAMKDDIKFVVPNFHRCLPDDAIQGTDFNPREREEFDANSVAGIRAALQVDRGIVKIVCEFQVQSRDEGIIHLNVTYEPRGPESGSMEIV
jgi:hypothetical protein